MLPSMWWTTPASISSITGLWHGNDALGSPAVANGVVYIGCRDSNVYALDLATGEKKWTFNNNGSWVLNSAAVYNGKVYFGTSDSGLFHELDAATGAKLFTIDGKFPYYASPAIANGALFLGTFDGRLLAYDLKTHEPLWTFQTEASKKNAPTYSKPDGSIDFSKLIPFLVLRRDGAGGAQDVHHRGLPILSGDRRQHPLHWQRRWGRLCAEVKAPPRGTGRAQSTGYRWNSALIAPSAAGLFGLENGK